MAYAFSHSPPSIIATTTLSQLYGPTAANTTDIIFSGTMANIDDANELQHNITLMLYNGTTYTQVYMNNIPIPFGSSSKVPKIVMAPGESLWVQADLNGVIQCNVNILTLS
jgi:hypothetical protein